MRKKLCFRLAVLGLCIASCVSDGEATNDANAPSVDSDDKVGLISQAFLSNYGFECNENAEQISRARSALDGFRTAIYNDSILECVKNRQIGGGMRLEPLIYAEHINRFLKQPVQIIVRCGTDPESDFSGSWSPSRVDIGGKWFAIGSPFTTTVRANLAGIIAHEFMHNKGYDDGPQAADQENNIIPANVVNTCVNNIINPAFDSTVALRTEMAASGEVLLGPLGANGGQPNTQLPCSQSSFATGLYGRAGGAIDKLGLNCSNGVSTLAQGGTGGSSFDLNCPANQLMVGVFGQASDVMVRVGPVCAATSSVLAGGSYSTTNGSWAGGTNAADTNFTRVCPPGHAVKTLRLRSGSWVDRMEIGCQRTSAPRSVAFTLGTKSSGTGGDMTRLKTCPSRSAVTTLYVHRNGDGVGRIAGKCTMIENNPQGAAVHRLSTPDAHYIGGIGIGADQEAGFSDPTPKNWGGAFKGLIVQTDGWIQNIEGVCAQDVFAWSSNGGGIVSSPAIGPNSQVVGCPSSYFLVGWQATSGGMLDSIQPICRRF